MNGTKVLMGIGQAFAYGQEVGDNHLVHLAVSVRRKEGGMHGTSVFKKVGRLESGKGLKITLES